MQKKTLLVSLLVHSFVENYNPYHKNVVEVSKDAIISCRISFEVIIFHISLLHTVVTDL